MKMTGLFRFALLPGADAEAFEEHMRTDVFGSPNALQLTRITSGFSHQLLVAERRSAGESTHPHPGAHYVWLTTVDLVTDAGYDFEENGPSVQQQVEQFAVLVAIESYVGVNEQ